jgi:aryl-alcohol dehydrogenase-like predicted oxidoreductase/predicted kinase
MRLVDDRGSAGEARARATIAAAALAGVTVFDTAHAYGPAVDGLGHNERLLAGALRACGGHLGARIVTKGGMTRAAGAWISDGRASAIRRDCEASLEALDGLAVDLYMIHAPDPRTPWRTSVRALARIRDEQLVRHVGLANVNRRQLDEALELVPVAAVEVALSVFDDRAIRGGVVARCADAGIAVVAHSPLGGPGRAARVARQPALAEVARASGATCPEVALAWLLDLAPVVVAIPGARRPETARSAARAATLVLDGGARTALADAFTTLRPAHRVRPRAAGGGGGEVVLVMGIPGAGKSRVAQEYVARGYVRLNRDERGGSLAALADALEQQLEAGVTRLVLDNTYLTRASRSRIVELADEHRLATRCVWLDTPLAAAQVNLVERLLDRFEALPSPEQLRALARRDPAVLAPTSQMRALRELEPPSTDEGLTYVEHVPFARVAPPRTRRTAVFVAAAALRAGDWSRALAQGDAAAPHLVFDWSADETSGDGFEACVARLAAAVAGPVEGALCSHGGGPPRCWCRPPLPGLPLAFARAHDVDPARSLLIGAGPAHRALAGALGARYVAV